jgi:hypothetical protein
MVTAGENVATTTAIEMARQAGVDPKIFRRELRKQNFRWHIPNERWIVDIGSERHDAMKAVLRKLSTRAGS